MINHVIFDQQGLYFMLSFVDRLLLREATMKKLFKKLNYKNTASSVKLIIILIKAW